MKDKDTKFSNKKKTENTQDYINITLLKLVAVYSY